MRIYIIGNDGITLCREPPAAVNEGEIVVASNEELHTARLSGKRLLALWNALPDVEKRKKVGDRDALVDELWSAIETLPEPQSDAKRPSKQDAVIAMLRRPEGATGGRTFVVVASGVAVAPILVPRQCGPSSHRTRRWSKGDSNSPSHREESGRAAISHSESAIST
jgi:hypothetical protein